MIDDLSWPMAGGANGYMMWYALAKRRDFIVVQATYKLGNTQGLKKYGPMGYKHPHCDKDHNVAQRRVANNRPLGRKVLGYKRQKHSRQSMRYYIEEQRRDTIVEYARYKPDIMVNTSTPN